MTAQLCSSDTECVLSMSHKQLTQSHTLAHTHTLVGTRSLKLMCVSVVCVLARHVVANSSGFPLLAPREHTTTYPKNRTPPHVCACMWAESSQKLCAVVIDCCQRPLGILPFCTVRPRQAAPSQSVQSAVLSGKRLAARSAHMQYYRLRTFRNTFLLLVRAFTL